MITSNLGFDELILAAIIIILTRLFSSTNPQVTETPKKNIEKIASKITPTVINKIDNTPIGQEIQNPSTGKQPEQLAQNPSLQKTVISAAKNSNEDLGQNSPIIPEIKKVVPLINNLSKKAVKQIVHENIPDEKDDIDDYMKKLKEKGKLKNLTWEDKEIKKYAIELYFKKKTEEKKLPIKKVDSKSKRTNKNYFKEKIEEKKKEEEKPSVKKVDSESKRTNKNYFKEKIEEKKKEEEKPSVKKVDPESIKNNLHWIHLLCLLKDKFDEAYPNNDPQPKASHVMEKDQLMRPPGTGVKSSGHHTNTKGGGKQGRHISSDQLKQDVANKINTILGHLKIKDIPKYCKTKKEWDEYCKKGDPEGGGGGNRPGGVGN
jgi:hypothetical protein